MGQKDITKKTHGGRPEMVAHWAAVLSIRLENVLG